MIYVVNPTSMMNHIRSRAHGSPLNFTPGKLGSISPLSSSGIPINTACVFHKFLFIKKKKKKEEEEEEEKKDRKKERKMHTYINKYKPKTKNINR